MNRQLFRALCLACLAIIAAHSLEESYQSGLVGDAVSRWGEIIGGK